MAVQLKHTEAFIFHAFLAALAELPSPLPDALQQEIQDAGKALSNGQTDAIGTLVKIATKDAGLYKLYGQKMRYLHNQYSAKERNKSADPPQRSRTNREYDRPNKILIVDTDQLKILTEGNPQENARHEKNKYKDQCGDFYPIIWP